MASLHAVETNAYDVLGVSPDDSAEEIDLAFHRLIKEGGYRTGVPLHDQWQRAREIKEAYATLGDPSARRAYDESLWGAPDRPLWPASTRDDPVDPLVSPVSEEHPPLKPTSTSNPDALVPGDVEPEQAPAGPIIFDSDEIDPYADQRVSLSGDDFSPDESRYGSAKLWGGVAATLALGALLYAAWPSGEPQSSSGETPAGVQQVASRAPTAGQVANVPPAVAPDGSAAQAAPEEPGDIPPMPDGLNAFFVAPGAAGANGSAAAPVKVALADETQAAPGAEAASGGDAASATAPAVAPASSGQTATAPEAAAPPAPASAPVAAATQTVAAVPPPPAAPQPQVRASAPVRSAAGPVSREPQWLGGGPTGADNPRGRYAGNVIVQFTVRPDGRVSDCGAVRGSGNAGLDALTCRLVEQRMRFKPALDAQGTPVASTAHARYEWGARRRRPGLWSRLFN